jgi:hypothetical protein
MARDPPCQFRDEIFHDQRANPGNWPASPFTVRRRRHEFRADRIGDGRGEETIDLRLGRRVKEPAADLIDGRCSCAGWRAHQTPRLLLPDQLHALALVIFKPTAAERREEAHVGLKPRKSHLRQNVLLSEQGLFDGEQGGLIDRPLTKLIK